MFLACCGCVIIGDWLTAHPSDQPPNRTNPNGTVDPRKKKTKNQQEELEEIAEKYPDRFKVRP